MNLLPEVGDAEARKRREILGYGAVTWCCNGWGGGGWKRSGRHLGGGGMKGMEGAKSDPFT